MQALLHSAFLQALGYAIANSLWQAGLLWLITVTITNTAKLQASKKYYVGVIMQFAGFIWFLFTLHFYYGYCTEAMQAAQFSETGSMSTAWFLEPEVTNFSSAVLYGIIKVEQLLPYLSAAYLCMLIFLAIRLGRAWGFTKTIRNNGLHKAGIDTRLFVKRTASYLGIRKEVRIYLSDIVKGPLTIGFIKPLILLPVASINHLTPTQLEAILLHELAHIRRADYLINIIQSIIETILFFNPFIQLLGKQIKKERENSCDDWVLQFQYKPALYAEALLRIASLHLNPSFAMHATGNKGDLLPRVKRMLNKQDTSCHYRNQLISFLLITVMLCIVAWFNPGIQTKPILAESNKTAPRKVKIEPVTASIDNPLFNLLYLLANPIQEAMDKNSNDNEATKKEPDAIINPIADAAEIISPLALESMNTVYENIEAEIPKLRDEAALAMKEVEWEKLAAGIEKKMADSVKIINNVISSLVQAEIRTQDWQQISDELKKASDQLTAELNQKQFIFFPGLQNTSEAIRKASDELKKLQEQQRQIQKRTSEFNKDVQLNKKRDITFFKTPLRVEPPALIIEKDSTVARKHDITLRRKLIREPYIYTNDVYTDLIKPAGDGEYAINLPKLYTPALFRNEDYSFSFSDTEKGIESAIIVIRHDPANENSHIKQITVEITDNNGVTKSYEFSVELYQ